MLKFTTQCSVYVCLLVSTPVDTATSCSSINVYIIHMLCMLEAALLRPQKVTLVVIECTLR
jgi:hypothetical protein